MCLSETYRSLHRLIFVMHFLFKMVWNKEMLHCHCI